MKIEEPSPKKMTVTLKQGSLYHEMGKSIVGLREVSKTHLCSRQGFFIVSWRVINKNKTKTILILEMKYTSTEIKT